MDFLNDDVHNFDEAGCSMSVIIIAKVIIIEMVLTPKHQFGRYFKVAKLRKENYSGHHLMGVAPPRDDHVPLPNPAPSSSLSAHAPNTPIPDVIANPLVSLPIQPSAAGPRRHHGL